MSTTAARKKVVSISGMCISILNCNYSLLCISILTCKFKWFKLQLTRAYMRQQRIYVSHCLKSSNYSNLSSYSTAWLQMSLWEAQLQQKCSVNLQSSILLSHPDALFTEAIVCSILIEECTDESSPWARSAVLSSALLNFVVLLLVQQVLQLSGDWRTGIPQIGRASCRERV